MTKTTMTATLSIAYKNEGKNTEMRKLVAHVSAEIIERVCVWCLHMCWFVCADMFMTVRRKSGNEIKPCNLLWSTYSCVLKTVNNG